MRWFTCSSSGFIGATVNAMDSRAICRTCLKPLETKPAPCNPKTDLYSLLFRRIFKDFIQDSFGYSAQGRKPTGKRAQFSASAVDTCQATSSKQS